MGYGVWVCSVVGGWHLGVDMYMQGVDLIDLARKLNCS